MVKFRVAPIKVEQSLIEHAYLLFKYLKVVAPKRCQRPLCWTNSDKTKFFESILMNRVEGTFIFIDIETAFEAIKREYQSNEKSYLFFEDLLKSGFKYIVIDGNNRYHFLTDLLNDRWLIPQGEYHYISDAKTGRVETFEVVARHRKFSDLPIAVQKIIKQRKSNVSEYSQVDLKGLGEIFTNVNAGKPLNRQEFRNVWDVDYADLVRELEDDLMGLLNTLISNPSIGLTGQEFIVDCLDFILNGIVVDPTTGETSHNAINQNSKDCLYKSEADSDLFWKIGSNFKLLQEYLPRMISEAILGSGNTKKVTRSSAIQNLIWMMCNGLDKSYPSVVEAMKMAESEYTNTKKTYQLVYKDSDDTEMTFRDSCNGMNKECMNIRGKVLNEIIDEVNVSSVQAVI